MSMSRRDLLRWSALGGGGLMLQSLATGLPISFLRTGSVAHATTGSHPATFLVLALSGAGDPLNANVFGSYPNPSDSSDTRWAIGHATVGELGEAPLGQMGGVGYGAADFETGVSTTVGGTQTWAARPWADLPETLRDRMAVIRHQTYTAAHPEFQNVLAFHGAVKGPGRIGSETLPAMIAQETAPLLGTTLDMPMSIGGDRFDQRGQPVRKHSPDSLRELFSTSGVHEGLEPQVFADYRDAALDAIYADMQANGTHAQRRFLDGHARSRAEALLLSELLSDALAPVATTDDPVEKQVLTAAALIEHRVTPVIAISLPFGGDNHQDHDLYVEVTETLQGIEGIRRLHEELTARGLDGETTFANLFVFNRKLGRQPGSGRGHYSKDHAMVLFGPHVPGGMYGQVEADLTAGPIEDVPVEETLAAAGKTLACACGVPDVIVEERIVGRRALV